MIQKFNEKINRKNTSTLKWDNQVNVDCLPFWIADSDYKTYDSVIEELKETSLVGAFGYNAVPKRFSEAVSLWYKKRYNSNVPADAVLPSTGVLLIIRILLDVLTKENDGVIIQTPVYHCFHQMINNMNRKIIENKLIKDNDTYYINYEDLENKFKEGHKVLIFCTPHNPVGRVWSKEEIEKVVLLAKKYNVFVIGDEIHSDLNMGIRKFISINEFMDVYENIAICNAPSKTFNLAGLYTSYAIIYSKELQEKFTKQVKRDEINRPTVFGYRALIKAYEEGDAWVDAQNEHLKNNYMYLKEYLNKELPKCVVTKLEGTYLVWLDLSYTNLSTAELLEKCGMAGVTCSGGVQFCKDYESYLRFNIACPLDQLKEGLERLVRALK